MALHYASDETVSLAVRRVRESRREQTRNVLRAVMHKFGVATAKVLIHEATGGKHDTFREAAGNPHFVWAIRRLCRAKLMAVPSPTGRHDKMPTMKISMLLHFYAIVGPYAPESARTSVAYTKFVKELLADGLIERPAARALHPGWAYTTTERGRVYIEEGLMRVPLPVNVKPEWEIPGTGARA